MTHYVEIERQYSAGLSIQYPDESAAQRALKKSFFIDALCQEDCLDAYVTQEPMDGYEVVIPPDGDTYC
ncbi:hypothetical protein ACF046_03110 [Glutamicibacter creatinolyticus]|uniref:hypothetical protein n=1 Tax=Glutamicibacter creatinolyticus TaxID=162496 RepID=UPI0033F9DF00